MRWKAVSKQLRKRQKCIVVPIGGLSIGFCRHRAILFKVGTIGQTQHQPAIVQLVLCFLLSLLRVPSASPEMFRNSQISSASHAGLRKVASTALHLTDHLALSKSTVRGDM